MSRKNKGQSEPERPEPKFDFLIPIRPDADPKDRSHYRVLAPGERLPPEYAESMLKHIARAFVDSLEHFKVRVADIPAPTTKAS
jgi:hypothetical protein